MAEAYVEYGLRYPPNMICFTHARELLPRKGSGSKTIGSQDQTWNGRDAAGETVGGSASDHTRLALASGCGSPDDTHALAFILKVMKSKCSLRQR
jgi:hypothetical protein